MRTLKIIGAVLALALVALIATAYFGLRASLPRLEGRVRAAGLAAPVTVSRDARGVTTLEAASRRDLAWATGFVHAQDRFFEMDLSRRLAAGELSELVGRVALEQDKKARLFRFRSVAREVLGRIAPEQRALLEAYSDGVNAGLADLKARPWEYFLLKEKPAAWRAEDSLLVVYAMWWDLQVNSLRREILRQEINARLKGPQCPGGFKCALRFLYPPGTSWDAPDTDSGDAVAADAVEIPDASVLDVRGLAAGLAAASGPAEPAAGSNSWAVAGSLTASGAALIANDMHLNQRVPTIWYHMRLRVRGAGAPALDLNGVTLPGAPLLVAGSNGYLAWGFTNSYGAWVDVEAVPCTAVGERGLTTSEGTVPLTVVEERIGIHGAAPEVFPVRSGPRGLLLRADPEEHTCWFGAWLAQLPDATNTNIARLEAIHSVAAALALAPEVGIPHQNVVLGDREGHIAWTIFGRIPEDTGWARARTGAPYTSAADHPHILDPPFARLWTANARVASGARAQELIGGAWAPLGAEYDLGARAGQIRDDLMALKGAVTPKDMLAIQLDDRARFLERWQHLLLELLDPPALAGHPRRAEARRLIEGWNARASTDSVGYRLVRAYRTHTEEAVFAMLLTALRIPSDEGMGAPAQFEGPLWRLVSERPLHLLAREYEDWPQFLLAQLDATLDELGGSCPELSRCTWGARNVARIRHPLSRALPGLSGFLDMPTVELPGDHNMPRVQDRDFGSSERFAVSPGREAEGYLELPGGQSGHPLSPYYRAGFLGWVHGEPLPFLPGAPQHTLTLAPN